MDAWGHRIQPTVVLQLCICECCCVPEQVVSQCGTLVSSLDAEKQKRGHKKTNLLMACACALSNLALPPLLSSVKHFSSLSLSLVCGSQDKPGTALPFLPLSLLSSQEQQVFYLSTRASSGGVWRINVLEMRRPCFSWAQRDHL